MDRTIRPVIVFLRLLALVQALFLLFAIGWAGPSPEGSLIIYIATQSTALFVYAILPRRFYAIKSVRIFMLWFATLAAITALPLIVQDLHTSNEPDWSAIKLRVLLCVLFLAMFLEAKKWKIEAPG